MVRWYYFYGANQPPKTKCRKDLIDIASTYSGRVEMMGGFHENPVPNTKCTVNVADIVMQAQ